LKGRAVFHRFICEAMNFLCGQNPGMKMSKNGASAFGAEIKSQIRLSSCTGGTNSARHMTKRSANSEWRDARQSRRRPAAATQLEPVRRPFEPPPVSDDRRWRLWQTAFAP